MESDGILSGFTLTGLESRTTETGAVTAARTELSVQK